LIPFDIKKQAVDYTGQQGPQRARWRNGGEFFFFWTNVRAFISHFEIIVLFAIALDRSDDI
jgi:hypothetical protein